MVKKNAAFLFLYCLPCILNLAPWQVNAFFLHFRKRLYQRMFEELNEPSIFIIFLPIFVCLQILSL